MPSGAKSPRLTIEAGTHAFATTALISLPWSEANEEKAKVLSAKLAEFLKLEDKGYPFGTPTAKLDQAVTGKAIGWLFLVIPTLISAFLLIFMKNVSKTFGLIAIIFGIFTPVALLFIAFGRQEEKRALRKKDDALPR